MGENPLKGAALPATPNVRFYEVISQKVGIPLIVTFLSDGFEGFWLHWEGRPLACHGPDVCPRCKAGMGHRWTGYIAVHEHTCKRGCILQLSEGGARLLLPLIAEHASLRGFMVELNRKSKTKKNAPITVKVKGRTAPELLPADFQIHASLARLWDLNEAWLAGGGMKDRPVGQRSPLPPPVRAWGTLPHSWVKKPSDE